MRSPRKVWGPMEGGASLACRERMDGALGHTTLRLTLTGASGCGAEGHVALLPMALPSKDAAY
jgi:hypothetical protein